MTNPFKFVFTALLLFMSLAAIVVCGSRIVKFFSLLDNFVIGDSYLVCEKPLNNRCVRHYTIYRGNGLKSDFVPFGTEFTSNYLDKGLKFEKRDYGFSYKINDQYEQWPLLGQQVIIFFLGLFGLTFWCVLGGFEILKNWLRLLLTRW